MHHRILFVSAALATSFQLFAQNPDAAAIKVQEGVGLHDKGEYKKAIKKYDDALELDKDNALAMAEKAMTLNALGELEQSAALCQDIITTHNGAKDMPMVYVTYGNCLDQLHRPEAAVRVYDQGISILPKLSLLHYNKGITLVSMDSLASAHKALQRSARLNPYHPGTQSVMAALLILQKNKVPAVLALCRFMVLEPEGDRAVTNLAKLRKLMAGDVETDKKGNTTIYLDAGKMKALEDSTIHENDFRTVETMMSLMGGLGLASAISKALNDEGVKTSPASDMKLQLELLAESLSKRGENFGFYWDYHAAWLTALEEAGHMEALSNLANASSGDKVVGNWLSANEEKIRGYYAWEKEYTARFLKEPEGE